jgi:hypothetical protein
MAVASAVFVVAAGWLVAPSPAAATQVVVVEQLVHTGSSGTTSCPPPPILYGPNCETVSAIGVSVGGLRVWNLSLTILYSTRAMPYPGGFYGSWRLEAADGSGDALAGVFHDGVSNRIWSCLWEVTSGAGIYAGATDAVAGGTFQSFQPTFTPELPYVGYYRVGNWAGGLRFTLA